MTLVTALVIIHIGVYLYIWIFPKQNYIYVLFLIITLIIYNLINTLHTYRGGNCIHNKFLIIKRKMLKKLLKNEGINYKFLYNKTQNCYLSSYGPVVSTGIVWYIK